LRWLGKGSGGADVESGEDIGRRLAACGLFQKAFGTSASTSAAHIAKQKKLIAELRRDGHDDASARAEAVLKTLEESHRIALEYLEIAGRKPLGNSN
jgi:hypothetical protein